MTLFNPLTLKPVFHNYIFNLWISFDSHSTQMELPRYLTFKNIHLHFYNKILLENVCNLLKYSVYYHRNETNLLQRNFNEILNVSWLRSTDLSSLCSAQIFDVLKRPTRTSELQRQCKNNHIVDILKLQINAR